MKLLVSACLLGARCKYSGGHNACPAVIALGEKHSLVPVCPERLGGLPAPRPCAERVGGRVMTEQGADVTAPYEKGAAETLRLARLLGCRAAVFKARSPSCGNCEIYDGTFSHKVISGQGVAAQALSQAGIPVFNETQLDELEALP